MRLPLRIWMVVSIAIVALLAYLDARRESTAAFEDFAEEHATIARAISLASASDAYSAALASLEQPGNIRVFVIRSDRDGLLTSDGTTLRQPTIEDAWKSDVSSVRLSREESAAIGLPKRTSVAGLGRTDHGTGVCVIATAIRERDREIRAQWRAVLSVLLAAAIILFFGGLALREQRKELQLARKLEVSQLEHERDEHLRRADKLATLGALATGIAHEVSTPLGVISGRAEQLLEKTAGDERASRAARAILDETKRIDEVIRGFLGLARGETPSLVRLDPERLAYTARDLVLHRYAKAGVTLRVDVEPDLPRIACEPRLFEQVLVNLLLNACEACDDGGAVDLYVVSGGDRVSFVVKDDGSGISVEAAERATEPFFTTKPKGTGLGLAIANEIVKHHHGRLSIAPGAHGTVATVELPAVVRA